MGNPMIEQAANSQQAPSKAFTDTLDAPFLYLSSRQAGWEGLVAEAFLEPTELHGWKSPGAPDIILMLFAGGPLHVDRRYQDGSRTKLVMREGDLVLRPDVSVPYEVSWQGLSWTPTRTLYLHLSRDLLSRTADDLECGPARLSLTRRERFQDPLLRQIGFALWGELEQSASAGKLYAQAAAQMLAVHLLRNYSSTQVQIKEVSQLLTQRQVKHVLDFVTANLSQDLTLEALAEQVGFSPYHFARLFRRTTGESPHQFVLRQRIEKAKYLLRETSAPMAQVALESGFANQSHLTHSFKRYVGLSPRPYRLKSRIDARFCND